MTWESTRMQPNVRIEQSLSHTELVPTFKGQRSARDQLFLIKIYLSLYH